MGATIQGPARLDRMPPAGRFLLVIGFWLTFLAWVRPLALPDEGRYAGVAWDMLRSGSHAVPLLNGMPYFHKPPLYYWLTELSFMLLGAHPWAARLPSLLASWAAIAALYGFLRRYRDIASATLSALILATIPLFYGGSQFANLDMLVAGMITLCVLAATDTVLRFERGQSYRWMSLTAAALAGLAVLAKGLIGLVLPGVILFIWLMWSRRWRALATLLWPPALLVFAAVTVPWFAWMQIRYPGFYDYFFIYQHFQRFAASGFNNIQPFWFYLPVITGLSLPWSLWGGGMLRKAFWAESPQRDLRRLALIWLVAVTAFFSLPSSKLVGYVLPTLPPLAFLLAEVIVAAKRRKVNRLTPRLMLICAGIGAGICVMAIGIAAYSARGSAEPLAAVIRPLARPGDTYVSLNSYPFDLALHAQAPKPLWVVNNWLNPEVPLRDNWRKELYDAAQFEPEVGKQVLISPQQFQARLCAAPEGARYWIWGTRPDRTHNRALAGLDPIASSMTHMIWLVVPDTAFKQRTCDGTPKNGS